MQFLFYSTKSATSILACVVDLILKGDVCGIYAHLGVTDSTIPFPPHFPKPATVFNERFIGCSTRGRTL